MTHDPNPPVLASKLLRACCRPSRCEEIEGDLCELYALRVARSGVTVAHRRYWFDVLDVCARQLLGRVSRSFVRSVRMGEVRFYPLRTLVFLATLATLLALEVDHPWALIAFNVLLGVGALLEACTYALVLRNLTTRRRSAHRALWRRCGL
jgi:hypothetical protein